MTRVNSKQFQKHGLEMVREHMQTQEWVMAAASWALMMPDRRLAVLYKSITGFNMSPTGKEILVAHLKTIAQGD